MQSSNAYRKPFVCISHRMVYQGPTPRNMYRLSEHGGMIRNGEFVILGLLLTETWADQDLFLSGLDYIAHG